MAQSSGKKMKFSIVDSEGKETEITDFVTKMSLEDADGRVMDEFIANIPIMKLDAKYEKILREIVERKSR